MRTMYLLTSGAIRYLHDKIIEETGGSSGVLNVDTLNHIAFECNRKEERYNCQHRCSLT
ncbi:hypothetical protein [Methanosalsum natronophilum]|uniref:hypothetical protein n=1 Tax=Methanosalsum natronophilum TaxID=768733 RepID=UPI002168DB98|nr:hypothetical protein [Methanosalsum natronophilum]MCS3923603.1 hypothetical protein [Methanosalsum natronophilum]